MISFFYSHLMVSAYIFCWLLNARVESYWKMQNKYNDWEFFSIFSTTDKPSLRQVFRVRGRKEKQSNANILAVDEIQTERYSLYFLWFLAKFSIEKKTIHEKWAISIVIKVADASLSVFVYFLWWRPIANVFSRGR